jgi:hypothetical protein
MELTPRINLIISYAKSKGVLLYSPQTDETQIREDSESRGYSSEDITGFWRPGLKTYITGNVKSFKKAWQDFGFFTAFKFLSLTSPWSGWVWDVSSFSSLSFYVAEAKLSELSLDERKKSRKRIRESALAVTQEETIKYLEADYQKVGEGMWVSKTDPSVIIYNEQLKSFDLPDGWSTEQLGEILEEWAQFVCSTKIKSRLIKSASW